VVAHLGAGGQVVADALLLASLPDHVRLRVAERDAHLGSGLGLLRELVGVVVEQEQSRVDQDLYLAGRLLDQ
jgi:hypothetical protein